MSSEDDNTKSDEYWMGVRDALRMVDSFHKWSKRNPSRAKNLEDFIHDGLIAAAKRCESCLRDKMGLSFIEGEDEEDEITLEESPERDEEDDDDDDVKPESSIEEPISHVEPETFTPPPDDSDDSSISIDRVERIEDESIDDLSIVGPPREFSTDFELVEPTPMVADGESELEPIVPTEPEEVLSESALEESETNQEPDSEEQPDKPSFTWAEYETAVTPSSEPEPQDSEADISTSEDEEISTDEEEEELPEEPPEPPKVWSPYDEPSIPEDDDTEEETEADETEPLDEGNGEPVITEPPAPPPPESEEDEEERKRRARRLFFGA